VNAATLPAVIQVDRHLPQSAAEMRAHVNRIIEVMQAVMKKDLHYGVVPGTKKPSLYKPGAEVLCVTFHIAPSYPLIEDLSGPDFTRYRVTCRGTHQGTGIVVADGLGECSTLEEKYKWRKAVNSAEFEAAPADRRRTKYGQGKDGPYTALQVRAEHHDASNTCLKMACKRAFIAMVLNATAASDCFTQDVEDLPEHLRHDDEPTAEAMAAAQKIIDERRANYMKELDACASVEAVTALWGKAVADFKEVGDREGADAFREAVKTKRKAVATPAETTALEQSPRSRVRSRNPLHPKAGHRKRSPGPRDERDRPALPQD
jgi:hypothetical protein